mmetsp:Transcript_13649/g.26102  ORF Transcript_13649/g.26102 Transcript_13649/m.26102 type:complete len:222 (+) Transcript_13649:69-734(+)
MSRFRPLSILTHPGGRLTRFLLHSLFVRIGLIRRSRVTIRAITLSLHVHLTSFHTSLAFRVSLNDIFSQSAFYRTDRTAAQRPRIILLTSDNRWSLWWSCSWQFNLIWILVLQVLDHLRVVCFVLFLGSLNNAINMTRPLTPTVSTFPYPFFVGFTAKFIPIIRVGGVVVATTPRGVKASRTPIFMVLRFCDDFIATIHLTKFDNVVAYTAMMSCFPCNVQ